MTKSNWIGVSRCIYSMYKIILLVGPSMWVGICCSANWKDKSFKQENQEKSSTFCCEIREQFPESLNIYKDPIFCASFWRKSAPNRDEEFRCKIARVSRQICVQCQSSTDNDDYHLLIAWKYLSFVKLCQFNKVWTSNKKNEPVKTPAQQAIWQLYWKSGSSC